MLAIILTAALAAGGDCVFPDGFDEGHKGCPDVCPPGRITRSNISYGIYPWQLRPNMDVTKWSSIWGAASQNGPVIDWPGPQASSAVITDFNRDGYIAAKFHVPAGFPSNRAGNYAHGINPPGPNIDATYSLNCGDFSAPTQAGNGCAMTDWPDDLSTGMGWKIGSVNPSYCGFAPDSDIYMNIRLHDPNDCATTQCSVYAQHTHN